MKELQNGSRDKEIKQVDNNNNNKNMEERLHLDSSKENGGERHMAFTGGGLYPALYGQSLVRIWRYINR